MILLTHILLSVISILATIFIMIAPTHIKLIGGYILFGLTIVSGIALVVTTPRTLTHVCISGVLYSIVILGSLQLARMRAQSLSTSPWR